MKEQELNNGSQPALQQTDVSRLLLLFDQMIKEENEALGKAGFYNQYGRETHANNKYCLAIVKSLIERRFGYCTSNNERYFCRALLKTKSMLEKEYQYYIDHKTELVEKYDGKFLIIKDENVIGVFDSEMEAYSQAAKEFEVGTFLIQQAIADTEENKIYFSRVTFSRCGTTLK